MSILIKDISIIDSASAAASLCNTNILIRDEHIDAVGDLAGMNLTGSETVFDGSSLFAVPGLVNAHYHSHDVLLKGSFDVMSLERWAIRALPRFYQPRSDEELYVRTLIGAAECLRSGITTVQDMLSIWPLTAHQATIVRDAYQQAGLRTVLGLQLADMGLLETMPFLAEILPTELRANLEGPPAPQNMPEPLKELEFILANLPAGKDDLVSWAVCPSSPERCSQSLMLELKKLANRYQQQMFCHVAISRVEAAAAIKNFAAYGGSPISYLNEIGVLGPELTLVHGVWLSDHDLELLSASGTRMVLNPMSNLKVRNGVPPVNRFIKSGIDFGLGCDNFSCSDAQNMFQAMKLVLFMAGLEEKTDANLPQAIQALEAATIGGANVLGLQNRIGQIMPGFKADITFLDKSDAVFRPLNNPVRQMVYGESGRGVVAVIVNGKFVVKDRQLLTINEAELDRSLETIMPGFRDETARILEKVTPLDEYFTTMENMAWQVDVGMNRMLCD